MLGITTSDAIALGSMIAALTAACIGLLRGDRANGERSRRGSPPHETPDGLGELAAAVRALVDVLRALAVLTTSQHPSLRSVSHLLHRNDEQ